MTEDIATDEPGVTAQAPVPAKPVPEVSDQYRVLAAHPRRVRARQAVSAPRALQELVPEQPVQLVTY
ncbi:MULTISPECIES: hypothetical protein [Streptomyces]|uniref:hypothetical protein n=1 Tax=Streptomyces TaxID=1883 RepID=UPI000F2D73AC|nr:MULTISPECIES: hypothetical protein [Streptomyces]